VPECTHSKKPGHNGCYGPEVKQAIFGLESRRGEVKVGLRKHLPWS